MRFVTFRHNGQSRLGMQVLRGGEGFVIDLHRACPGLPDEMSAFLRGGDAFMELAREAAERPAAERGALLSERDVELLAPVPRPGKILCVGHNYIGHLAANRTTPPEFPTLFCKPATVVCGPGAPILKPRITDQVDFEAELAVVIGRSARRVPESAAMDCIAGYTAFNDISARDFQNRTSQWMLGKAFDTFGPMGPAIVTRDEIPDPHTLDLALTLNGVERQRSNTRFFLFSIPFLISYLSAVMTLEPGDVIATGTPAKLPGAEPPAYMQPGDVVSMTIEKIGSLANPVAAEPDSGEWRPAETGVSAAP
jgi:2-keto-4-pentenoate hydratase/2-oxohepta-3-ene-1,7-dioic acid hydratase in catechol pathway